MVAMYHGWTNVVLVLLSLVGCVGSQESVDSQQGAIGLGIVEGTKGYQYLQQKQLTEQLGMQDLQGQVTQIEGGAYMIRDAQGTAVRLPLDENTQIDRPAHVGDWIGARLDSSGRALNIRNIDGYISLE
ncbi:MAG: hypothetical protein KC592_01680 [Nitrospira sp.]|nr:hypothetical protein [Nitrospira sp.]